MFRMLPKVIPAIVRDRSGNFGLMAGILALPIFLAGAFVMNIGMATLNKTELQNAVDAATLAAATVSGTTVTDQDRTNRGTEVFNANFRDIPATIQFAYSNGVITGTGSYKVPLIFGKLVGKETLDVATQAVVPLAKGASIEMVLALDYSGSMRSNNKYVSMRDAAISMLQQFKASDASNMIKVGIVPFSEYVLADIDASYIRVVHPSHHGETARACLGSRFSPFATDGASPDPEDEDSKWPTIGLSDYWQKEKKGGPETAELICEINKKGEEECAICTTTVDSKGKSKTKCKKIKMEEKAGKSAAADQEKNQSNYNIDDPECQAYLDSDLLASPMTNNFDALISQLQKAKPVQLTNISLAMDLSWHMISPQAPYTQSQANSAAKPKRYVVLFTDGAQTVPGYGEERGRSGKMVFSIAQAEQNTADICTKLKAEGIDVMTVAFQLGTGKARNQMQDCASKKEYFFETSNQGDLAGIFTQIANLTGQGLYLQR